MPQESDHLGGELPEPKKAIDEGKWGGMINDYLNDTVEPAIVENQSSSLDVHNIKEYGATGDGQTDDSGAIQQAINTASTTGGLGVVWYPEPDVSYECTSNLIPKSGVYHIGPQPYGSTITASGLGKKDAVFDNRTGVKNVGWYGLDIDASGAWQGHGYHFNQKCIAITPPKGSTHSKWRNLFVERCWTHGSNATSIGIDSIINQHYYYNIVEGGGTDSQGQGSNGLGIGVGQVDGPCPTWVVGNWVRDTAEFGIIFEQTGNNVVSEMFFVRGNVVEDARVGIGLELVQGFNVAGNVIRTSPRMDYGVRVDHLDDTVDPAYGSVVGNSVMGEDACNIEAGLIGSGASYVGAWGNVVEPSAGDGVTLAADANGCTVNGRSISTHSWGSRPNTSNYAPHSVATVEMAADGAVWTRRTDGAMRQMTPADPMDLSGKTASTGNFLAFDDGTNTKANGVLCRWDGSGSQWVPMSGDPTFS